MLGALKRLLLSDYLIDYLFIYSISSRCTRNNTCDLVYSMLLEVMYGKLNHYVINVIKYKQTSREKFIFKD